MTQAEFEMTLTWNITYKIWRGTGSFITEKTPILSFLSFSLFCFEKYLLRLNKQITTKNYLQYVTWIEMTGTDTTQDLISLH